MTISFLKSSTKSSPCVEATPAVSTPVKSLKRSISALSINSIGSMNHLIPLGPVKGHPQTGFGARVRKNRKIPAPFEEITNGDLTPMTYKPSEEQCHSPLISFNFDSDDQCSTTSSRISSPILHSSSTGVWQDNHWASQNSSFKVGDSPTSTFKKPLSTHPTSVASSQPSPRIPNYPTPAGSAQASPAVNRYPPCYRTPTNVHPVSDCASAASTKGSAREKLGPQRFVRNIRDSLLCSGNRLSFLRSTNHEQASIWSKDTSMTSMSSTTDRTVAKLKKLGKAMASQFKSKRPVKSPVPDLGPIYQPDLALLYQMSENARSTKESVFENTDGTSSNNNSNAEVFGIPIDIIKEDPDTIGAILYYLMNEGGHDKAQLKQKVSQIVLRRKESRNSVVSAFSSSRAVQRQPSDLNKSLRRPPDGSSTRPAGKDQQNSIKPFDLVEPENTLPQRFAALGIFNNQ